MERSDERQGEWLRSGANQTAAGRPKYWQDIEQSPALLAELELIPSGSNVLEIGSAGGHMTRALIAHGCRVTAIERDAESGSAARQVCERVLIADVEEIDFDQAIGKELFDIILLGDVLEHLVQPEKLLGSLRPYVTQTGSIVVSLPNVAHASVRLALLEGRFEYRTWGLLDATHLRFFTRASMKAMFERSGWIICDTKDIEIEPLHWEIEWDPLKTSSSVLRRLSRDADAFTYQFVFKAAPRGRRMTDEIKDSGDDILREARNPQRARRQLSQFLVRRAVRHRREGGKIRTAIALLWKAILLSPRFKTLGWLVVVSLPPSICERLDRRGVRPQESTSGT